MKNPNYTIIITTKVNGYASILKEFHDDPKRVEIRMGELRQESIRSGGRKILSLTSRRFDEEQDSPWLLDKPTMREYFIEQLKEHGATPMVLTLFEEVGDIEFLKQLNTLYEAIQKTRNAVENQDVQT